MKLVSSHKSKILKFLITLYTSWFYNGLNEIFHIVIGVMVFNQFYVNNGIVYICGPGGSSGKALGYGLDGPGSIPGVGGVEILLHSFVSRLVLGSTQPSIK